METKDTIRESPKARAFFFHFNKPASMKEGRAKISVHYMNACYLVDNIVCGVATKGRTRNSSPKFVMTGKAKRFELKDGIAYLK